MKSYGETITEQRICEKILASLPPKFDTIVIIVEEFKDLSTLSIHKLMGSLKTHEQKLFRHKASSLESIFQSKLMVFDKNSQRDPFLLMHKLKESHPEVATKVEEEEEIWEEEAEEGEEITP